MVNKYKLLQRIALSTALVAIAEPILACTFVPPMPPPVWFEDLGIINIQQKYSHI